MGSAILVERLKYSAVQCNIGNNLAQRNFSTVQYWEGYRREVIVQCNIGGTVKVQCSTVQYWEQYSTLHFQHSAILGGLLASALKCGAILYREVLEWFQHSAILGAI